MTEQNYDVAIAHKDYDVAGGGEILAERLGLCFDAPVFTGFVNDQNRADLRADVRGLWGDGLAGALLQRGGLLRQLVYQAKWPTADAIRDYDVVIQSGNEPLWYVPPERQTTVAYTHSTPRMQYDLAHRDCSGPDDGESSLAEQALSAATVPLSAVGVAMQTVYNRVVRTHYYPNTRYPDLFVANSDLVARRIQKYWGVRDERIRTVYPPIPTDELGPHNADPNRDDFYLSINRLDAWKRIDEIVDAFADLDHRLVVAGKGPAKPELEARAADADNIEFVGYVSDAEKRSLLASAKAVVYNPLNEDFGMVPIEALASGTPVISVRDGFQRYQLTDGTTAVMYDRDIDNRDTTIRNLKAAVRRFEAEGVALSAAELAAEAEYYRVERFNREMRDAVADAHERARIEPKHRTGSEDEPLPEPATDVVTAADITAADGGDIDGD